MIPTHHRRSIRLKEYDYAQVGAYFVTICARDRECLLGDVIDGEMRLNEYGQIVMECWDEIPRHFPNVELDEFVVMPNHVHGILVITVGARHASPLQLSRGPQRGSLGAVVGSFKSAATKRVNERRDTPGLTIWQRNYYEHVIRNEDEMNRIREYVAQNPAQWAKDENNPLGQKYGSP